MALVTLSPRVIALRAGLAFALFIVILGTSQIIPRQAGAREISPAVAAPTTLVLQEGLNGYQGTDDSFLDTWYPDLNYGSVWAMVIRMDGIRRPLIRFDLSAIPPGSAVTTATLELFSDNTYGSAGTPLTIAAYVLRRSWVEDQVNWNQAAAGQNWGTPGADDIVTDRDDAIVATTTVADLGTWYVWNVTAAAQRWVDDPSLNKGLLLLGSGSQSVEYRFFSSEYGSASTFRPRLTITFAPPPTSPTPSATPTATPMATPTPTPTVPQVYAVSPLGVYLGGEASNLQAWELVAQAGLQWGRRRLDWKQVEPTNETPPRYNWDAHDQIAANAQAAGVGLIWVVGEAPAWAATSSCGPVDLVSLDRFALFFRAAVERYPQNHYWELVNEPDWNIAEQDLTGGCFGRYPNAYAALLKTAWQTLHDVNPQAELLFGGLIAEDIGRWQRNHCEWQQPRPEDEDCINFMQTGGDFFDQVLQAGAAPYFDLVNVHSYYAFHPRWDQYGPSGLGKGRYYEQRLAKAGTSKPLAISEMGVRSDADNMVDGVPASEEKQARFLVQAFARTMSASYRPIIWFTLLDFEAAPNLVYGFGLLHIDWSPKRSFYAAQTYTRELGDAQPVSGRFFGSGFESYRFAVPGGGETEVAWTTTEVTATVSLPCSRVRVVDKAGNRVFVRDGSVNDADGQADGQTGVRVSPSPVYVRLCPLGDVNCDGRVQADDLQAVAGAWGLHQGDAAYSSDRDQDGNGDIDLQDVMIASAHQGDACAWPP